MDRLYDQVIAKHFLENRQMLFLTGPRQVGKTTTSRRAATSLGDTLYLNWDHLDHRRNILAGPDAIAAQLGLDRLRTDQPFCVLDELHKLGRWKTLLKGLFDTYGDKAHILATGSARLDVFKKGGDSLMGRYFGYRMHPISVGECARSELSDDLIVPPSCIDDDQFDALWRFGGFPEPILKANLRFWRRWRATRAQLFREDLRDLTHIRELGGSISSSPATSSPGSLLK